MAIEVAIPFASFVMLAVNVFQDAFLHSMRIQIRRKKNEESLKDSPPTQAKTKPSNTLEAEELRLFYGNESQSIVELGNLL